MNIKAEFLDGCVVSGERVDGGTVRELREDVFKLLQGMGKVRKAPEPILTTAPKAPEPEAPAAATIQPKKRKGLNNEQ